MFAGMLQIGCGTVIAQKKLEKKISRKIFRIFFLIFFLNLIFFFENVVSGNLQSRSASDANAWLKSKHSRGGHILLLPDQDQIGGNGKESTFKGNVYSLDETIESHNGQ
jgi:hypothetical protein